MSRIYASWTVRWDVLTQTRMLRFCSSPPNGRRSKRSSSSVSLDIPPSLGLPDIEFGTLVGLPVPQHANLPWWNPWYLWRWADWYSVLAMPSRCDLGWSLEQIYLLLRSLQFAVEISGNHYWRIVPGKRYDKMELTCCHGPHRSVMPGILFVLWHEDLASSRSISKENLKSNHNFCVQCALCQATSSTAQGGGGSFKREEATGKFVLVIPDCQSDPVAEWSMVGTSWSVSLFVCLTIYLFICLSLCLSIWLTVSLSDWLSDNLSIYLSVCLSVCQSVSLFVCLSDWLSFSIWLTVWQTDCLTIDLSIFLSVCQSVSLRQSSLATYLSICLSVNLSANLSIYLSVWLTVWQSIYLSVCLSVRLSIWLSDCLTIFLSVWQYLSLYLSIYLPVWLSDNLSVWPVCLSDWLSIYLSIYLSVCLTICLSNLSVCQCVYQCVCPSDCLTV